MYMVTRALKLVCRNTLSCQRPVRCIVAFTVQRKFAVQLKTSPFAVHSAIPIARGDSKASAIDVEYALVIDRCSYCLFNTKLLLCPLLKVLTIIPMRSLSKMATQPLNSSSSPCVKPIF